MVCVGHKQQTARRRSKLCASLLVFFILAVVVVVVVFVTLAPLLSLHATSSTKEELQAITERREEEEEEEITVPRRWRSSNNNNNNNNKHLLLVLDEPWVDAPRAPLPVYAQASFLVANLVFMVGGFAETVYKTRREVQVWNMKLNQWLPLDTFKPLPENAAETHQAVASGDGFLFLVSGQLNEACSDDATKHSWALHVATDTLMRLPQLPAKRYGANGAYFLGELHAVGGAMENRATASSQHWMLPFGRALRAARWPLLDTSSPTDGQQASVSKEDIEKLQQELDKLRWQEDTEYPEKIVHAGSIVVGNSWYMVAGDRAHEESTESHKCNSPNKTPSTTAFYRYDFCCDGDSMSRSDRAFPSSSSSTTTTMKRCRQWIRLADLPKATSHIEQAVVHFEGFLIVVGGSRELNYLVPFVQAYSIIDNAWNIIHEFAGGIKSVTCWLQNCTTTPVALDTRKQCSLFAAAGEPGKPVHLVPAPPSTNRVAHSKLRFVDIGWPEMTTLRSNHLVPVSINLLKDYSKIGVQGRHNGVLKYALKEMEPFKREEEAAVKPLVVNLKRVGLPVKVSVWTLDGGSSGELMHLAKEHNGVDRPMMVAILYTLSGKAHITLDTGEHTLEPGSVAFSDMQHKPLVSAETDWVALQVTITISAKGLQKLKIGKKITALGHAFKPLRHDPVMRDLLQGNVVPSAEGFFHVDMDGSPRPAAMTKGTQERESKSGNGLLWSLVFGISGQLTLTWGSANVSRTSVRTGELVIIPKALESFSWTKQHSVPCAALAMELSSSYFARYGHENKKYK